MLIETYYLNICSTSIKCSPMGNTEQLGLYTITKINAHPDVGLSQGGLLLIALMAGGDYTDGVSGCGRAIAHGLAMCGFGDSLYEACNALDGLERRHFISNWLVGLCEELRTNSLKFLPFRNPGLAESLSEAQFPNNEVINLYIRPLTSFSPSEDTPNTTKWTSQEPDIEKITSMAVEHLGWRHAKEISQTFHNNLWEGVFTRMILSVSHSYCCLTLLLCRLNRQPAKLLDLETKSVRTPYLSSKIIQLRRVARKTTWKGQVESWYRLIISTQSLLDVSLAILTASNLKHATFATGPRRRKGEITKAVAPELAIWLPESYFPPQLRPFKRGTKQSKRTFVKGNDS